MTFEVTLEQAKGVEPIPDKKLEEFAKINRTVIATYRRNPISFAPLKNHLLKTRRSNHDYLVASQSSY